MLSKDVRQGDFLELRDKRYEQDRLVGRLLVLFYSNDGSIVTLHSRGVTHALCLDASTELFSKLND